MSSNNTFAIDNEQPSFQVELQYKKKIRTHGIVMSVFGTIILALLCVIIYRLQHSQPIYNIVMLTSSIAFCNFLYFAAREGGHFSILY
jgi:hypothetical protein